MLQITELVTLSIGHILCHDRDYVHSHILKYDNVVRGRLRPRVLAFNLPFGYRVILLIS